MINPGFKKTILISLLSHITVFGIFSFSFGYKMPSAVHPPIVFWGQFFKGSQLTPPSITSPNQARLPFTSKPDTAVLDECRGFSKSKDLAGYYFKPQLTPAYNRQKEAFIEQMGEAPLSLKKREPTIILHPLLPYGFTLYFRDRQVAHVELVFKIESFGRRNAIAIRRKISSGNLEVDLLSMRYISRYLFIQQANFLANKWQTVKIDLSAKND